MRLQLLCALAIAAMVPACSDDSSGGGGGGGGGGGTDTGGSSGPAYEVDASVEGGSSSGDIQGESESPSPSGGETSLYYASITGGSVVVNLASSSGTIIMFQVTPENAELPGHTSITGEPPDGTWLTITSPTGIQTAASGAIHVDACPSTTGEVISGSFMDVGLNNITGAADGTLNGSFRATLVTTDGSVTCAASEGTGDGGSSEIPGASSSCPNASCDGPCCPYMEPLAECTLACEAEADPTDPFGMLTCLAGCPEEIGMTADEACMSAAQALSECEATAGCDQLEGDAADECTATSCCSEAQAAY